jgi:excisionase family DNA binding protein
VTRWPDDYPPLLTVPETAELLRLGTNAVYRAVKADDIPSLRIGGAIRLPRAKLEELLLEPDRYVAGGP